MYSKCNEIFLTFLLGLALLLVASPALSGEKKSPSEDTIAVVNGSVISMGAFDSELKSLKQRSLNRGMPLTGARLSEAKKEVLENIIERELLFEESIKMGIAIDSEAVTEEFNKLKKRFESEDKFKEALNAMGTSVETLKAQLKKGLAIQKFIDQKFVQKIKLSPKEIKSYFDDHQEFFKQPEQAEASHILIKVDPKADESKKAEAKKEIMAIQKKLKEGEDFSALAKEVSQCPSGKKGGGLGYFGRGQMVKPFEEAVFSLGKGDVSDIVETKFGYHLIKCLDKKPEIIKSFDEVKDNIEKYLKTEQVRKEVDSFVEKLKENAKIERFLTENTKGK